MLSFSGSGSFDKTDKFLARLARGDIFRNLQTYAGQGVAALASATPVESGVTAASWSSEIQVGFGFCRITWTNNHIDSQGTPIAIMLQYGHGTGTGGYVQGRDYINPAIKPVFDQIANAVWREVTQ